MYWLLFLCPLFVYVLYVDVLFLLRLERIHQVQGELARAKKKLLQKPKVPKSSQV
jgi:hypothetical protein